MLQGSGTAELLSKAGGWCQSCWNVPHPPVVQEWHRGAVALVPVVGVAGLWFLARVALLCLVDCPTQLNFYGFTTFAAGRDGKQNKCEKLDEKMRLLNPKSFLLICT